jgi:hypothetical protein
MNLDACRDAFVAYLAHERSLSANTVKAYSGDVADLNDFASTHGVEHAGDLTLAVLRDWLWNSAESGLSQTTLARRAASARAFTAWMRRTGVTPGDAGVRLKSPKPDRSLPRVVTEAGRTEPNGGPSQQAPSVLPSLPLLLSRRQVVRREDALAGDRRRVAPSIQPRQHRRPRRRRRGRAPHRGGSDVGRGTGEWKRGCARRRLAIGPRRARRRLRQGRHGEASQRGRGRCLWTAPRAAGEAQRE